MTQSKIVSKIRKLGYNVTVLNASARNRGGILDTIIPWDAIPVFLEIKIDKDKISKLQKEFILEFEKSCYVLHYDSRTSIFSYIVKPKTRASMFYYELDRFMSIIVSELNAN